jgi:hypothetical protein
MKFVELSGFADPDVAARKLVEIANAVETVHDSPACVNFTGADLRNPKKECLAGLWRFYLREKPRSVSCTRAYRRL